MKLTQGPGDNIIQKGDVFRIDFNSSLPLSFSNVPEDSLFDIDITGKSALELTYRGDTTHGIYDHTLPGFNFKFKKRGFLSRLFDKSPETDELSGGIGMNVVQLPKHGNWEHSDTVSLHADGIDVGRMQLISVSNTPVFSGLRDLQGI